MSIRNAFTSTTVGTLNSIGAAASLVERGFTAADRVAEVGLVTATEWRDSVVAGQAASRTQRELTRIRDHKQAVRDVAKDMRKLQRELDEDPELAAIYYELLGQTQPKLKVAAE